jgi:ATP-binding protein involved in chromosome partitioning
VARLDDTHRSVELFAENDVPVLNMGSFTCPSRGDEHALYPNGDPRERLDAPVLAELPFTTEMQQGPTPGAVPAAAADLGATVRERLETVWNVPVPDGAVDLRDVPPAERKRMARAAVEDGRTDPLRLVSDRDPRPALSFVADLRGVDERAITDVEVTQPNPETWLLQARVP